MTDPAPILRFFERSQAAARAGAKDLRLTLGEALELAAAMGQVMTIRAFQTPPAAPAQPSKRQDRLDGGVLKSP